MQTAAATYTRTPTFAELNANNDVKAVASILGGRRLNGQTSQKWQVGENKYSIKGQLWTNITTQSAGAGAVRFTQDVLGCDWFNARDFLTGNACAVSKLPLSNLAFDSSASETDDQSIPALFEFNDQSWPRVRSYLVGTTVHSDPSLNSQRCLSSVLIDHLHASGQVGAQRYFPENGPASVNAVFRRHVGGAFVRSISQCSSFKASVGNSRGGSFVVQSVQQAGVAFVESPVDAISLHQLHPHLTVVALGGGNIKINADLLAAYVSDRIFAAFDCDRQGEVFTADIMALRPDAVRMLPPGGVKDWNTVLQKQFGKAPAPSITSTITF